MKSNGYTRQAKAFAQAIRAIRRDRGLSQTDVAEYMRALGFAWTQTTLYQVETGARHLRLAEALALADFLEVKDYKAIGPTDLAKVLALAEQIRMFAEVLSTQVAEAINNLGEVISQITDEGGADGSES